MQKAAAAAACWEAAVEMTIPMSYQEAGVALEEPGGQVPAEEPEAEAGVSDHSRD